MNGKKSNDKKTNFGDILEQWESSAKTKLQKNSNANKAMNSWLDRYGTFDKDAQAESFEERKKMRNSEYVKKLPVQDTLDLHGMTQDEAWKALNVFVANSKRKGFRKILIIHGKGLHSEQGDGVLASLVRKFIEGDQRLGSFGKADKTQGGSGAMWAIIRS